MGDPYEKWRRRAGRDIPAMLVMALGALIWIGGNAWQSLPLTRIAAVVFVIGLLWLLLRNLLNMLGR